MVKRGVSGRVVKVGRVRATAGWVTFQVSSQRITPPPFVWNVKPRFPTPAENEARSLNWASTLKVDLPTCLFVDRDIFNLRA